MIFLGVDPGQSGGFALLGGGKVCTFPMRDTEEGNWLLLADLYFDKAAIENVHSMPGQGVHSMFKFGEGFGGLKMALTALIGKEHFELVTPRTWQKHHGIAVRGKDEKKPQFKLRLKDAAHRLFPKHEVTLSTCDALLIAAWLRDKYRGK